MKINIFLTCFNESLILPSTIKHYKSLMPSCSITIYDNESTDNSIELARELGCDIRTFSTGNNFDEQTLTSIRNMCWKNISDGWIIVADMDEWLCITEEELLQEVSNGTTIITTRGLNMIGESNMADLSDITLSEITKCKDEVHYSKRACFFRTAIVDMNYTGGSHFCFPNGQIKYSLKSYIYKHMTKSELKALIKEVVQETKAMNQDWFAEDVQLNPEKQEQMTTTQLNGLNQKSAKMLEIMKSENVKLEPWMIDLISQAYHNIDAVANKLMFGDKSQ